MILNQDNLTKVSSKVVVPTYDRSQLKSGIVHIGVGGFHRSHQAYYINRLLASDKLYDWGICGVGLRQADRAIGDVLSDQDGLYTLITQHPDGTDEVEIIGAIGNFLLAADSSEVVIDKMAHPDTRIVSLTITEGGYNFNPSTGEFDFENEDVQQELAHPDKPKTVFGFLSAALRKRKEANLLPFTILSCDNIQHNGDVARKMMLAFAHEQDPILADWMAKEVKFPNTMVDRITPVTTTENIQYLKSQYDMEDGWPVICEPFIQWVIEDNFSNGRPPLEKLGVQFVPDVTPYEKMKIRLLNAGHSVLGIPGAIHGHPTIDACMSDSVFSRFMRAFMDQEATPLLGLIEGINLEDYKDSLEKRFANPNLKDSVGRICSESSAKLPKFLIPTLLENLASGGSITYATFILAAWCYYSDLQETDRGESIDIIDAKKDQLNLYAKKTKDDKHSFLYQAEFFGDLSTNDRFLKEYECTIEAIYNHQDIRSVMEGLL